MPCRSDEEEAQTPGPPNPVTPTKPPRNDGACYDNSDAQIPLTQSDEEEEERRKQKRKRVVAEYEQVKRWVTGKRAVLPEEDIERELFEEARELMHHSRLKKLPGHKGFDTDLHLRKKASAGHKTRTGMSYTINRCPWWHRCKCMKTIGRGGGILILERYGLHDVHSHEENGPSISSMIKLFHCPRLQLLRQIFPVLPFAETCYCMTVRPRPLARSIADA
jgi:hypothetical protein